MLISIPPDAMLCNVWIKLGCKQGYQQCYEWVYKQWNELVLLAMYRNGHTLYVHGHKIMSLLKYVTCLSPLRNRDMLEELFQHQYYLYAKVCIARLFCGIFSFVVRHILCRRSLL